MARRHIAVFTHLGDGHVYPALGLCTELVKRGYRVTYAANEHYAERISQTGAEPVIFQTAWSSGLAALEKVFRPIPLDDPRWWMLYATVIFPRFFVDATVALAQIQDFYRDNVPDLVLYDRLDFAGRILSQRLGAPAALMCFHFAFHQRCMIRERGVCGNPEPMLRFGRLLDCFFSAFGIDEKDNLWRTERLNLYFLPKAFQYHGESFAEDSCFVGPCLNRPTSSTWSNHSGGKPIVLISGSSILCDGAFFQPFLEALSDTDYHVILSIGKHVSASSLGALPANFEVNRDAYNLEILPHASVMICQCGMGTALESIYYGVPLIAVPPTPAHAEVADRVAELGLGIHLPQDSLTAKAIRDGVQTALEDISLLNRVKVMQKVFRDSGGAEMACNRIEEFLHVG